MKRTTVLLALAAYALAASLTNANAAPVDPAQSQAAQKQLSSAPASMQAGQIATSANYTKAHNAKWTTRDDGAKKALTAAASTGYIKKIAPATVAHSAKALKVGPLDEQFVLQVTPQQQGAANFVIKPQGTLQQAAIGDTGGTGFGKSSTIKAGYTLSGGELGKDYQPASKKSLIDGTPQQLGALDFKACNTAIS